VVGEGLCRRYGRAGLVRLDVTTTAPDFVPRPGVQSPFLNGKVQAAGQLWEMCRPNTPLLKKGGVACLRLQEGCRWTVVEILVTDLGEIENISRQERLYQWGFIVVGQRADALDVFPSLRPPPPAPRPAAPESFIAPEHEVQELEVSDLLALLGAGRDDLGSDGAGGRVSYNAEGGFFFRPGH
jgi:hypothetical protein